MSWSMPTSGQWNPGVLAGQVAPMATAMTPAMPQDMGNYTPEQWTMMQQQNWQQWAQWQQQYAQWQTQYGDKYAMQMQAVQQMGGAPMPAQAPPPAPPPPAHPPPPPHENDAPLYSAPAPAPAPAPAHNANNNATLGNNSWSGPPRKDAANAEALKKLAEEERLFDIQFKKWEEEIDKWKRDNVNHPDKQAYKEYEDKFEACRAQLMERRQQMNQRRAKLTGVPQGNVAASGSSAAAATTMSNNIQVPITANSAVNQVTSNTHSKPPTYYNKKEEPQQTYYNQYQGYPNQGHSNQGHSNQGHSNQGHSNQGHTNQGHSNQGHSNQGHFNQGHPNQGQSHQQQKSYNDSGYGGNTNNAGYSNQGRSQQQPQKQQQRAPEPSSRYGDGNIKSIKPQERYEDYQDNSYQEGDNHNYNDKNNFLTASGSNKGIPGLDLVPEEKKAQAEVIDITEDQPKAPDYTTISKGINNILGDEKIMNILNMVRGSTNKPNAQMQDNSNSPSPWNNQQNNLNMPFNRQDMNQQNQGQQMNQQQNYPNNQGQHPPRIFNDRHGPQGQYNENNSNSPYDQGYDDQNYQNNRGMNNMPMRPNLPAGRLLPGPNNMQNSNNFPQQNRNRQMGQDNNMMPSMSQPPPPPPPKPQWVEEPMFTPQLVVDYEHMPLRLKARDFIEPVHTFDYNHQSTDEYRKKEFDRDDEELFSRNPRRLEDDDMFARRGGPERFGREPPREYQERYRDKEPPRDFERRLPRDDIRDDFRPRYPPREDDRRRLDERFEPGRRDDRIEPGRRDDRNEPGRRDDRTEPGRRDDRDRHGNKRELLYRRDDEKERAKPERRDDRNRSNERARDNEGRRRAHSVESDHSSHSAKKAKETKSSNAELKHVVMIDDLLEMPGREMRPEKIVVILRGPPGSGKSYLAKLIRDKEAEFGSTARIMSIDDYFVQEAEIQEKDPETGKMVKKSSMKYEYEEKLEETYLNSLKRAFKRSLTDGYFPFLIYDACNDQLKSYADVWNFARQNGFQVYICTMELDAATCHKRNIHSRTLEDIQVIVARWFPTPAHHIQLDATSLLQSAAIQEVEMEDADDVIILEDEVEVIEHTSKWEKMDDVNQLARLDGTSKPLRPSQLSMADYLQLDEWQPTKCTPGKKTVRWADIEEGRQQEKMRAIGFVVGQTDWNRMTDPSKGSSALTQTKYIERVRRNDY